MINVVRRHPLGTYFVVTLAVVWLTVPLALAAPAAHGILNAFTPALAAIGLTAALHGAGGVRALLARLTAWRVGRIWYVAVFGIPVAMAFATVGVATLLGSPVSDPLQRMPATLLTLLLFLWVIAPGEELGWRGFALPRLVAHRLALVASLVLGAIGVLFHISAYFLPLVAPDHTAPGMPFPAFVIQYMAASVVWTWIFTGTRGSVLMTALFHGTTDVSGNFAILALDLRAWSVDVDGGVRGGRTAGDSVEYNRTSPPQECSHEVSVRVGSGWTWSSKRASMSCRRGTVLALPANERSPVRLGNGRTGSEPQQNDQHQRVQYVADVLDGVPAARLPVVAMSSTCTTVAPMPRIAVARTVAKRKPSRCLRAPKPSTPRARLANAICCWNGLPVGQPMDSAT